MTLSDAMRLGAAMVPQAFGDTFVRNGPIIVAACAWSSVSIGLGFFDVVEMYRRYPELHKTMRCPACDKTGYFGGLPPLEELIVHLNDDHRWTREQIADWIDTLTFTENENATEEICAAV